MLIFKTPSMAHQSHHNTQIISPQPSKLNKPHHPKANKIMEQEHKDHSIKDSNTKTKTLGPTPSKVEALDEDSGRERLKRHRIEVAGRVWIPEIWGQEELLKDWIDCSAFDAPLVPNRIVMARAALVEEGRRATSGGLRIENRC
ncbi:protein BIC1-like [Cajanus cajan]|uniref:protein BIC1-like n=1 Tax=Cajanus cajan TaxID=3821 RepID=UPI00098DC451|nr:protein BIC1-like [Cajanus cajan]